MFKFKAWNIIKKRFLEFEEIENITFSNPINKNWQKELIYLLYTGIKDISGVEIYQDDIVIKDDSSIGGSILIGEVDYISDLSFAPVPGFGLWNIIDSTGREGGYATMNIAEYKVIGNKYESDINTLKTRYMNF